MVDFVMEVKLTFTLAVNGHNPINIKTRLTLLGTERYFLLPHIYRPELKPFK
jgi:hypothetical protein